MPSRRNVICDVLDIPCQRRWSMLRRGGRLDRGRETGRNTVRLPQLLPPAAHISHFAALLACKRPGCRVSAPRPPPSPPCPRHSIEFWDSHSCPRQSHTGHFGCQTTRDCGRISPYPPLCRIVIWSRACRARQSGSRVSLVPQNAVLIGGTPAAHPSPASATPSAAPRHQASPSEAQTSRVRVHMYVSAY